MKKTIVFIGFVIVLVLLVLHTKSVSADWYLAPNGDLYNYDDGDVLSRTDNASDRRNENANKSEEDDEDEVENEDVESESDEVTRKNPPGLVKNQAKRVLLEAKNNKLELKFLDEDGEEVENEDAEDDATPSGDFILDESEDENTTLIRSHENAAYVIRNKVAAKTNFPLMVNLETNELIVTTPNKGSRVVTVLPDKAVENMLAANVLDQLGGKGGLLWLAYQEKIASLSATPTPDEDATSSASPTPDEDATPSATPTEEPESTLSATPTEVATPSPTPSSEPEVETAIELTSDSEGNLVYEIEGLKFKKLLGLYKIELKRLARVSAETGELIDIEQDLRSQILDLLSTD